MSEITDIGWLKNPTNNNNIAPKTLASQVIVDENTTLADALENLNGLIAYKTVTQGNITIGSDGYGTLTLPSTPEGYTFLTAHLYYWQGTTKKVAFSLDGKGQYIIGTAGDVINIVKVRYFYIKSPMITSLD